MFSTHKTVPNENLQKHQATQKQHHSKHLINRLQIENALSPFSNYFDLAQSRRLEKRVVWENHSHHFKSKISITNWQALGLRYKQAQRN
jgi:hypothetical protein